MAFLKRLFGRRDRDDILVAFELHSVEQIRAALDAGLDPRAPIRGKSPVNWLTEMYSRGDNFPKCLRLLLDRGAVLDDPVVAPVLLNDAEELAAAVGRCIIASRGRRVWERGRRPSSHRDGSRREREGVNRRVWAQWPYAPLSHRQLESQSLRAGFDDAATRRGEE